MAKRKQELGDASEKEVVLLGLLAEAPAHAYGLEQKIRERRMTEWTAIGLSSIYRVLESLEARRFIASELQQAGQGAARRVYQITPQGQQALATGVEAYLRSTTGPKHPFNVGLAFASHLDGAVLQQLFEARVEMMSGFVSELAALIESHIGELPPVHGENGCGLVRRAWLGPSLLFAHLRGHLDAELQFLKQAVATVKSCHCDCLDAPHPESKTAREVKS